MKIMLLVSMLVLMSPALCMHELLQAIEFNNVEDTKKCLQLTPTLNQEQKKIVLHKVQDLLIKKTAEASSILKSNKDLLRIIIGFLVAIIGVKGAASNLGKAITFGIYQPIISLIKMLIFAGISYVSVTEILKGLNKTHAAIELQRAREIETLINQFILS